MSLRYNAPELFGKNSSYHIDWKSINFRKCDVWAFGLLCLEALIGGKPYYGNRRVLDGLSLSSGSITSGNRILVASTESQHDLLAALRPWIRDIALMLARQLYSRFTSINFIETFRHCLVYDPAKRIDDASALPILAHGVW
jgi:serine/threonine protein kinase